jgi:predicted RNA binding protein YcfA (HicA-like mRNA interferase family)
MSKFDKLVMKILSGQSDNNIEFAELIKLLLQLNFEERIKGSHHIYYNEKIEEIINLQPQQQKAKPYQVKQVRNLIIKYKLISF